MTESRALFGVTRGGLEFGFGETQAGGAERKAADVENVEGNDVTTADFVQQVFARHVAILEEDRRGGTAAQAHFLFLRADGKSGEAALDNKGGELFAIDFCGNGENVSESAVGDPH